MSRQDETKVMTKGRLAAIALTLLAAVFCLTAPAAPAAPAAMSPAPPGSDSRQCLDCHRLPNLNTDEGVLAARAFCLECHGQKQCARETKGGEVSLYVDQKSFAGSRHEFAACVQCHFDVGRSPHKSIQGVQCLSCHAPHGEGLIHDPHLRVRCEACHNKSKLVKRDPASGLVALARVDADGKPLSLADHGRPDLQGERFCQRCHYAGNPVQAPASVLPAKSLLCFLCHPASLSMGGGWFGLALLIMLAGLAYLVWFWLRGGVGEGEGEQSLHAKIAQGAENAWRTLFSREFPSILAVIVLDVILQRRLLMESVRRWLVHSLIFLSILARMGLGLFTWLVYQIAPQGSLAMALLDKNQGFVALTNDLLGLFILLGTILALVQRFWVKPDYALREGQDAMALALILLIVSAGFTLEAARIMMGQLPAGIAVYSFVGYAAARILNAAGFDPTAWYVYLWWTHALLAAGFAAYLPFGKMRHMFTAPLSLLINRKLA